MKRHQVKAAAVYAILEDILSLINEHTDDLPSPIVFVPNVGYRFHVHQILPTYMILGEYSKACVTAAAVIPSMEYDQYSLWFTYKFIPK